MRKIIYLLLFFTLSCYISTDAQNILAEDFSNGAVPGDWSSIDNDNDGHQWGDITSIDGHLGGKCVVSSSYISGIGSLSPDNWLLSPMFYLPINYKLSWWVASQDANYYAEHYAVYIIIDGYQYLVFEETMPACNQKTWYNRNVDLSSWAGNYVQCAFRHYNCSNQYMLCLDDVEVSKSQTVTIPDISYAPVKMYPSPTSDFLHIETGKESAIEIYNVEGQLLLKQTSVSDKTTVNVSDLSEGTYFIRIADTDNVTIRKIIKN